MKGSVRRLSYALDREPKTRVFQQYNFATVGLLVLLAKVQGEDANSGHDEDVTSRCRQQSSRLDLRDAYAMHVANPGI